MTIAASRLDYAVRPEAVFDALYRDTEYAFWLDSAVGGRFSFMGAASRVARAWPDRVEVDSKVVPGGFFDWLARELTVAEVPDVPFGFTLGWVG